MKAKKAGRGSKGGAMKEHDSSRREFVKKAAYVAPAVLSLKATSAFAKCGSGNEDVGPDNKSQKKCRQK